MMKMINKSLLCNEKEVEIFRKRLALHRALLGYVTAVFFVLSALTPVCRADVPKSDAFKSDAPKYKTILRWYSDFYGNSASLPVQFETHVSKFVLTYRGVGIGTSVFKLYAKDVTTSDIADEHKVVASWAPIYLYIIPFASSRKAGDVIPFTTYFFLGGSSWGLKDAKFFDVGLGFTSYLLDFRTGYNTISSASRNPFMKFEDVENFEDYRVSWNNFYISVSLSTGFWMAVWTKSVEE